MGSPRDQKAGFEQPLLPAILVGVLFFGGIALGVLASLLFARESALALVIGFTVLPVCFGLGMSLWYSVADAEMIRRAFRAVFRGFISGDLNKEVRSEFITYFAGPLPGTRVFVPVTVVLTFAAGVAVGLCPSSVDMDLTVAGFTTLGLAYSLLITWLARQGYLPAPPVNPQTRRPRTSPRRPAGHKLVRDSVSAG